MEPFREKGSSAEYGKHRVFGPISTILESFAYPVNCKISSKKRGIEPYKEKGSNVEYNKHRVREPICTI